MSVFNELNNLRRKRPLVHNMTNQVVANQVANGLLAIGASPIMAYAREEVEEISQLASALVLNIGTVTTETFLSMLAAGHAANQKNIPVILDPVGVGASEYRSRLVRQLLTEIDICLIRGNSGELASIGKIPWQAQGVDGGCGSYDLGRMAKEVAQQTGCVVAISGPSDWISDGQEVIEVQNGQEIMAKVTGMGCLLSGVCGAFIGSGTSVFKSTVAAHVIYGVAGEKAYNLAPMPGQFQPTFIDQLSVIGAADKSAIRYHLRECEGK